MQPVGVQDHFSQNVLKFGFGDGNNVYMKKGGGPTPFLPMGKLCLFPFFPIFPMEKMGKKYMEREGNEYFSLFFRILFSPWGKMGKDTFSHGQKWCWTPQKGANPIFYRSPGIWIWGWEIFVRLKRFTTR